MIWQEITMGDGAKPLLEVRDLRTEFDTPRGRIRAVDGIGFEVAPGQTLCLVGESGCGKTVTALSVLQLLDPRAGRIAGGSVRFAGEELVGAPVQRIRSLRGGQIAMIFQEPATSLNPVLSVGAQIAEAVTLHRRLPRRQVRDVVLKLLDEVRIPQPDRWARRYPHELSGGMLQRVMIAMALAGEPRLLIADEPTTALDVTVQAEIVALLRRMRDQRGLAILLITHDLGLVAQIADRVAVMYAGQIVEEGNVLEIFERTAHPYTQGLLRSIPRVDAPERPVAIDGSVPDSVDWLAGCRFRNRCPRQFDRCAEDPLATRIATDHTAACWLLESGRPGRVSTSVVSPTPDGLT